MVVALRLFGPLAQHAGTQQVRLEIPGESALCRAVRRALTDAIPTLEPLAAKCRFAVNNEFVDEDATVRPQDEVALIGMVSGG